MTRANSSYRAARDLLQEMRTDRTAAVARFEWPDVGDSFNWAVDWFDPIARGNDRVALRVVAGDGSERQVTFDEMATRSDRVATWLVGLGVRKGDHVMLMLGNRVELWETMLAIMKAGAVILPTSTVLGSADLADRVERAGVRHVIADLAHTAVFDDVPGSTRASRSALARTRPCPPGGPTTATPTTRPRTGWASRSRPRIPRSSTSRPAPRASRRWWSTRTSRTRSGT